MKTIIVRGHEPIRLLGQFKVGVFAALRDPMTICQVTLNPIYRDGVYAHTLGTIHRLCPTTAFGWCVLDTSGQIANGYFDKRGQCEFKTLPLGQQYSFGLRLINADPVLAPGDPTISESVRRIRLAADKASIAWWFHNVTTGELELSAGCMKMLGFAHTERPRGIKGWQSYVHADDTRRIQSAIEAHLSGQSEIYACEHRVKAKGGQWLWVRSCGGAAMNGHTGCMEVGGLMTPLSNGELFATHAVDALDNCFVFVKDRSYRFQYINRALAEAFGRSPDDIVGHTDAELNQHVDEVQAFNEADRAVLEGDSSNRRLAIAEERFTDCNHHTRCLATIKQRVRLPTGEVALLGVSVDITDRAALQQSLREKEQELAALRVREAALAENDVRLCHLLDVVDDAIYFKDTESRFLAVNEATAVLAGTTPQEMVGKKDADFFAGECAAEWRLEEQQIVTSGKAISNRLIRLMTAVGPQWRAVSKYPISDSAGRIVQIIGISRDVTEIVLAKNALRFESELLARIFAAMPHCMWVKDNLGRYIKCNIAFAKRRGYETTAAVVGKTDYDHWSKEEAERYRKDDQWVMDNKKAKMFYREMQSCTDGRAAVLVTSKIPLLDVDGDVIALLGIYEEVDSRVRSGDKAVIAEMSDSLTRVFGALEEGNVYHAKECVVLGDRLLNSGT